LSASQRTGIPEIYSFRNNGQLGFRRSLAHSTPIHKYEGHNDHETRGGRECENQLLAARMDFLAERE
jgi:hypothetical protein